MKYKIICCLLILIQSCCLFGGNDSDDTYDDVYAEVVAIAKPIWRLNNALLIAGLPSDQVEKQMPAWLQEAAPGKAYWYVGSNTAMFFFPVLMTLGKFTFVHWIKKLKNRDQHRAPNNGEEDKRNRNDTWANSRIKNNKEEEEPVVLFSLAGAPLITSDTAYDSFVELMRGTLRHASIERANNQQLDSVVLQIGSQAVLAGTADMTYNVLLYALKKVAVTLELQNPFDTNAQWYKKMQSVSAFFIKRVIAFGYCQGAAYVMSMVKQKNN